MRDFKQLTLQYTAVTDLSTLPSTAKIWSGVHSTLCTIGDSDTVVDNTVVLYEYTGSGPTYTINFYNAFVKTGTSIGADVSAYVVQDLNYATISLTPAATTATLGYTTKMCATDYCNSGTPVLTSCTTHKDSSDNLGNNFALYVNVDPILCKSTDDSTGTCCAATIPSCSSTPPPSTCQGTPMGSCVCTNTKRVTKNMQNLILSNYGIQKSNNSIVWKAPTSNKDVKSNSAKKADVTLNHGGTSDDKICTWGYIGGPSTTPTFGEVFYAPAGAVALKSFTFTVETYNDPINYEAHIYEWDCINGKAIGAPLISSGDRTVTADGPTSFTIDISSTPLPVCTTGAYVAVLTTLDQTINNINNIGIFEADTAGKCAVYDTMLTFAQLSQLTWDGATYQKSFLFEAVFSSA